MLRLDLQYVDAHEEEVVSWGTWGEGIAGSAESQRAASDMTRPS